MDYLLPLRVLKKHIIRLKNDSVLDLDRLKEELVLMGYERCSQVEGPGQFSIRGEVLIFFPLTEDYPYRIELWGDEVDSIRSFDVESQRSIENVEEITLYPATELVIKEGDDKKKALVDTFLIIFQRIRWSFWMNRTGFWKVPRQFPMSFVSV